MKLKNSTMLEFFYKTKDKKIYCFGAGLLAQEMFCEYPVFKTKKIIYKFIDNNPDLNGKYKYVGNFKIPIISMEKFLIEVDKDSVILFTLHEFKDVFLDLENNEKCNFISSYSYRMIRACDLDEKLFKSNLPENALLGKGMQKIPKIIHYCWFGDSEMDSLQKKCIESWERNCSDYEIICWNEKNYNVSKNKYMFNAYKDKKWAFVSDYARLDIIYQYGGIYLDTDVELLKNIDQLLYEKAFCGFENKNNVNFGLGFGAEKQHIVIKDLLELYDTLEWDNGNIPCPIYQTMILKKHGLVEENSFQRLKDIVVLPVECLAAKSIMTRKIRVTSNTFAIHHFASSWYEFTNEEREYIDLLERAEY